MPYQMVVFHAQILCEFHRLYPILCHCLIFESFIHSDAVQIGCFLEIETTQECLSCTSLTILHCCYLPPILVVPSSH